MAADRLNVILVMTDQHRGDCLGAENDGVGSHPVLTPNLDQLAAAGARFSSCYATVPSCVPARRSLLSGQFPTTHGMVGYATGQEWEPEHTLPSVLRDAGYHTYLVGRNMHQHPQRRRYGYDEMVLGPNDYNHWLARQLPVDTFQDPWFTTGVMHNDVTARSWPYNEELHYTNWTVHEARRFLARRDPSVPFFLTMSFLAPHAPLLPPQFYLDRYMGMELSPPIIGEWARGDSRDALVRLGAPPVRLDAEGELLRTWRAAYYASINHIDDQIRRVIYQIDGIEMDNTIIVFTADHGDMLGDHGYYAKQLPYEGSARIPLIIRAPKQVGLRSGQVVDAAVCLEDIMPTVLELVGIDVPDSVDGTSLVPLLTGERRTLDREFLHLESAGIFHALTDGKEKYIWFADEGAEQFFDLIDDPHECHDLTLSETATERVDIWRDRMINELTDRPERFVQDGKLVAGVTYEPMMPR